MIKNDTMRLLSNQAVYFRPLVHGLGMGLLLAIAAGCGVWNTTDTTTAPNPTSIEEPVANQPETIPDTPESTDAEPTESPSEVSPAPASTSNALNCENAQTQTEITTCAQQNYEDANETLSQLVNQIRNQLPEGDRIGFGEAEQAWLTYRDQNCDFESSLFAGGSIEPTMYYSCMERMTSNRIETLQNQP